MLRTLPLTRGLSLIAVLAASSTIHCGDAGSADGSVDPMGRLERAQMTCFYEAEDSATPAATIEFRLETFELTDSIRARLTLDPRFVDNSFGAHAIGWERDHTFDQLVGSDHAQLIFSDATQQDVLDIKMDYLSRDEARASGFGTLGVSDKDGKVLLGEAAHVLDVQTSLDHNLNRHGYAQFVEDSPETDSSYTPNPAAPSWDYRVVYDVWVAREAFGAGEFGAVRLDFIHASPSKVGTNTVEVTEESCPEDWCPGGCENLPGDGGGVGQGEDPGEGVGGDSGSGDGSGSYNDVPA